MNALRSEPATRCAVSLLAAEPESPWEARGFADLVPHATLGEARARRDELATLLGRERAAAADFLLALADFDRRRGWERLGHASLFAFLTRELGLSNGAAYLRSSAARLLPRFASVEAALRDGRLCLSAVGELARVLTAQNEAEMLPRYCGRSAREAREITASILPQPEPPRREVVTSLRREPPASVPAALAMALAPSQTVAAPEAAPGAAARTGQEACEAPATPAPLRAHEVGPTHPTRVPHADVEPMTAELRRLHLTVSAAFLDKLAAARTGLSHAMPRASMEQALEAALDLLLEKQARRKALVKRPRASPASPTSPPTPTPTSTPTGSARPQIPAAMEREVRLRDGDRCQWPLDAGGVCSSTWQVELDHIRPVALGGPTEAGNLRCACRVHNQRAAVLELGEGMMGAARARRGERPPLSSTRSGTRSAARRGRGTGSPPP